MSFPTTDGIPDDGMFRLLNQLLEMISDQIFKSQVK